jgi:hypothetical protein
VPVRQEVMVEVEVVVEVMVEVEPLLMGPNWWLLDQ